MGISNCSALYGCIDGWKHHYRFPAFASSHLAIDTAPALHWHFSHLYVASIASHRLRGGVSSLPPRLGGELSLRLGGESSR